MRARRRRGHTVAEIIFATALGGLLIGVHGGEVARQQVGVRTIAQETKARNALLTAKERLRAGLLKLPAEGASVTLPAEGAVTITLDRLAAELPSSVIAVRLRASWSTADGATRKRELTTLVSGGTP